MKYKEADNHLWGNFIIPMLCGYSLNPESIKWYLSLPLNMRINIKEVFILACGIDFQAIGSILSFKERIDLLYMKLKKEGIL